jgi:CP family cyanate transporter-like MFS transporter
VSEQYYRMPWQVLSIGFLMAFGMWLPLLVVPAVEDVIGQQLQISHTLTALLFSAPVAMLALVAIPGGFLTDKVGIKRAVGLGAAILAAGSALRGISSDFPTLMGFTMVYGLGLGLCFPNLPKLARHCTPRERSNITVGMFTVAILVSGALSLTMARAIFYPITHSFQGVFFISSIPAIVAALLWWIFIHDPPCESAGVQTISLGLASLRKIVTRPDLWLVALLFLLHNIVLYTVLGWMPAFLINIGAQTTSAALITSVILWAGTLSILVFTRLSTKLGRRRPFLWGSSFLLIFALYGALLVNLPTSWVLMFFIGLAAAIRFAMILALPVEIVTPEQSGSASGLVMSVGYVGALAGPAIGGFILDSTHKFAWVFLSLAVVSAVTTGIAFIIPETGSGTNK